MSSEPPSQSHPTTTPSASDDHDSGEEAKAEGPVAENAVSEKAKPSDAPPATGRPAFEITYPGVFVQAVLIVGLLMAMFLVALDMSIISTAIPVITVQFHSVDQVGWYGSAFFMCLALFQAFWGKMYKYYSLKIVFLACIIVFELGSLIVAVAHNSITIIAGRAIQGAGGAGVTGGCYVICAFIVQPPRLPAVMGIFGTVWSCSSVLGPVLGGVFTENVTWRWCFWVNLPIGGATMAIILLFFKTPKYSRLAHATPKELSILLDLPGMIFMLAAFVCILLALEDGGITQPWNSSIPIGLIVGFGLLVIVFSILEWKQGERAMVVGRIMKRRSIAACAAFNFFAQAGGFARVYNLPIYFQAAQGVSPAESGIRTLPSVLTISIFSLIASAVLGRWGYYQAFLWGGAVFMTVGSGLIYTLNVDSPSSHYIGYQVVTGIGMGLSIQVPAIVAQSISTRPDMAITVAIALFYQFVGGAIGVSSAQSIMNNRLIAALPTGNPAISASSVLAAGAANLRQAFPNPQDLKIVVDAYMIGLKDAWIFSIASAGITFLIAFTAEWKSIKPDAVKARVAAKAAAAVPSV